MTQSFNIPKKVSLSLSGDVHINLRQDSDFEVNRVNLLTDSFIEDGSDILVLIGDVFNYPKPTYDELSLFYSFISKISKHKTIYILQGNHEALSDNLYTFDSLPQKNFTLVDWSVLQNDFINIHCVGHNNIDKIFDINCEGSVNILLSHIRCNLGHFTKEEVSFKNISKKFDYSILGDIHYNHFPEKNIQYTSSPYSLSYTKEQTNGYILLNLCESHFKVSYRHLNLPSKYKVEVNVKELYEALRATKPYNKYRIFVEGLTEELEVIDSLKPKENVKIVKKPIIETLQETPTVDFTSINYAESILQIMKSDYQLSDEFLKVGESFLRGIDYD